MSKSEMYEINGTRIKELIKEQDITETELAKRTGYSLRRLNDAICNNRISISMLDAVARELNYSPEYLRGQYTPELTGNDPISKQLFRDLVCYDSHFNNTAKSDVDLCIKKLCLAAGLDYGFVNSLSSADINTLKERIESTIWDFHFDKSVIRENGGLD
ncbi:MAG: helix-turn-helix transcriptional regulator [Lachnospiraceae bacterium]|nr:helix-turn-helix transcriptional regulator [Lachnospiraceae bacterium]